MSRARHVPQRTCMGCHQRAAQPTLVRIALDDNGNLQVVRRAAPGRSGYLHQTPSCWRSFAARKGVLRSLGRSVDKATREALFDRLTRAAVRVS